MVRFEMCALRVAVSALLVFASIVCVRTSSAQPFRVLTPAPASPSSEAVQSWQSAIDEQARGLADEPALEHIPFPTRQALVEFILGNVLFVAAHEIGFAVISEANIPTILGEEQAADDFAALSILRHGEIGLSDRVLIAAAKGWFASTARRRATGGTDYYAEHRLTVRRGHRIVCLMTGASSSRFADLAEATKLPAGQRRTCGWEYDTAARTWGKVLAPFRRASDQPRTPIAVTYGPAPDGVAVYARALRNLSVLEVLADSAAERFAWRAPIAMEMASCGVAGATWIAHERRLRICYEAAADFADLYRWGNSEERR